MTVMNGWIRGVALAAIVVGSLTACGGEAEVSAEEDEAQVKETPIADSLKEPIERAQAVEDLAMDRKDDMDRRLAEMEGNTSDDDGT